MSQTLHALLKEVAWEITEGLDNPCCSHHLRFPCGWDGSLFLGLPGERVDGGRSGVRRLRRRCSGGDRTCCCGVHPPAAERPGGGGSGPRRPGRGRSVGCVLGPSQPRMALIGVTGTNGKTTTTHLIEHLAGHRQPIALFGTLVNRWPGHSITATHTTAFADRLQAQLAEAASGGAQFGGHGGEFPCSGAAPCGRLSFRRSGLHQSHPGSSGLSPVDGGLFRGQGFVVCRSAVRRR